MGAHKLLTEHPKVKKAQAVLDEARQAVRDVQPAYDARFRAWETAARVAVGEGKNVPPRPAPVPTAQEKWDLDERARLAGQNFDAMLTEAADEIEAKVFARHAEILEELRGVLDLVADRSGELRDLGHSATILDAARGLGWPAGKREHVSGSLDPYLVLKTVERGDGFLDWKSSNPGPARGPR